MHIDRTLRAAALACAICSSALPAGAATAILPDGRRIMPAGFTIPVESFSSSAALSPDGRLLAVLSQDAGAIDVLALGEHSALVDRLEGKSATSLAWTSDGLYVARGYTGTIARFTLIPGASKNDAGRFVKRPDLALGAGLLNGVAEDPGTHRIAVARTAAHEVVTLDDASGAVIARRKTSGEPFAVGFAGDALFATLYNSDRVAAWRGDAVAAIEIPTGPHPTQLLTSGSRVFVSNADGHDVVALDAAALQVTQRYDLSVAADQPPGQSPAGMALSADGTRLFVTESGFNDVAIVELRSGRVEARIPAAWYPMAVAYLARPTGDKDSRSREQLYVVSAQGLGSQPDPGGEWNGTYTGLVQHVIVEPNRFREWSAQVARNNAPAAPALAARALPPIKHVVFIVRENKQFDEEFGDERNANADPSLLLYGRRFTPNAHALAERYTLFDNFMGNGEASIYGHAWAVQGIANDYHERNAHARDESSPNIDARVPWSIWPYPVAGEDTVTQAQLDFDWFRDLSDLPAGPRVNVSGIFGPRGELLDELQRKHVPFRVFGEQMTMQRDGRIATGLAAHADRAYPGAHIDYDVLDTERARLFLADVGMHGLAAYSYVTLPTDHTAGNKAGFYTPASYVSSNDLALGTIVAGLSHLRSWRDTIVVVTTDDPQGTGDHVDAHRQPAFALGPWIRHGYVDHTRYSLPSILRTVETLYGLAPLNIEDAYATPMYAAFARQPDTAPFAALPSNVALERNFGKATSLLEPLDGPGDEAVAEQEWASLRGDRAPRSELARRDAP